MSISKKFTEVLNEKFKTNNSLLNNVIDKTLINVLKKISGVDLFEQICNEKLNGLSLTNAEDLKVVFERLDIKPIVYSNNTQNLGKQYIIVCNHPTGPLDGVMIQKICASIGLKGKIIGDDIMSGVKELHDSYIGLSIRVDGKSKVSQLREMKKQIKSGISVAIFPSGSVSHFDIKKLKICEYEWQPGFIEIAKSNNLDILPVYIDANLSFMHYLFKDIYSDISSLRLFMESKNFIDKNKGKTIDLFIGEPISTKDLESTLDNAQKIKDICENLMFESYENTIK